MARSPRWPWPAQPGPSGHRVPALGHDLDDLRDVRCPGTHPTRPAQVARAFPGRGRPVR